MAWPMVSMPLPNGAMAPFGDRWKVFFMSLLAFVLVAVRQRAVEGSSALLKASTQVSFCHRKLPAQLSVDWTSRKATVKLGFQQCLGLIQG